MLTVSVVRRPPDPHDFESSSLQPLRYRPIPYLRYSILREMSRRLMHFVLLAKWERDRTFPRPHILSSFTPFQPFPHKSYLFPGWSSASPSSTTGIDCSRSASWPSLGSWYSQSWESLLNSPLHSGLLFHDKPFQPRGVLSLGKNAKNLGPHIEAPGIGSIRCYLRCDRHPL